LAKMTGPGKVLIQSLPFSRLADRISAMIPVPTFNSEGNS